MRPLLVSIALLLLALCRLSDSAATINDVSNVFQKLSKEKQAEVLKKMGEYSTLITMFEAWLKEKDPTFNDRPKSLDNGVQCMLADTTVGEAITKQMYDNGVRIPEETEIAKALFTIDCAVSAAGQAYRSFSQKTPKWDCFCTKKSTIFYCAAHVFKEKHITAPMGKCKKEALDELKLAGKKTLGKIYDYAELVNRKTDNAALTAAFAEDATAVDKMIAFVPEAVKLFCDAIDPEVEKKVKTLFASDVSFFFAESAIMYAAVGQDQFAAVGAACESDAEFKSNDEFGSCLCAQDRGILFCAFKAYGNQFKTMGYLDCAADKLVDEKKPAAAPHIKPQPKAGPTTAPDGGGNGTTTAAPSDGAATSSLLLAPLAALLLLRQ